MDCKNQRMKRRYIDNEIHTWMRFYGFPCHAWSQSFFELNSSRVGVYACSNDNPRSQVSMGLARLMIWTRISMVLNETFNVQIYEEVFIIKVLEDSHGPLRIVMNKDHNNRDESYSSSDRSYGDWEVEEIESLGSNGSVYSVGHKDGNDDDLGYAKNIDKAIVLFDKRKTLYDNN